MKKEITILLLIILSSAGVIAVDKYIADEFFMSREECDAKGYDKILYFNTSDGSEMYYCLRAVEFSTSEEFLADSFLVFGAEECTDAGYDEDIDVVKFSAYLNKNDYNNNQETAVTLCKKRQSRNSLAEVAAFRYKPFTTTSCSGITDSFVDKNNKTIYHCQTFNPGTVSADTGECEDTDGSDVKTIDKIKTEYGILLDEDAYGFDPPLLGLTFPAGKMPPSFEEGENFVEVKKDYCVDRYILHENYCDVSTKQIKAIEFDCPWGGECDNGKCLNPEVNRADQRDIEGCYDTDVGSGEKTTFGSIDFFNNEGAGFRYYDVCSNDREKLFEYFCKTNSSAIESSAKYRGENITACDCSEGVCIGELAPGETCADTDSCARGETCEENEDCIVGSFCLNKICVGEYEDDIKACSDTDAREGNFEPEDIFEPGTVTKGDIEIKDICNGIHLMEAICSTGGSSNPQTWDAKYRPELCPEGADCRTNNNGEGYCNKPASDVAPECAERETLPVGAEKLGDQICVDRWGIGAYCKDSAPPVVLLPPGCEGGPKEVSCDDKTPRDISVEITCCWEQSTEDRTPVEVEEPAPAAPEGWTPGRFLRRIFGFFGR